MLVPYIFLATFVCQMLGITDRHGLALTVFFSVIAAIETLVIALWFRRPVAAP